MFAQNVVTLKATGVFTLISEEAELTLTVLWSQVSPMLIPLKSLVLKITGMAYVKCSWCGSLMCCLIWYHII